MGEKFKILVVDDELPVCKSIASALAGDEYSIDTALSGEEALEYQEKKHYDAIIADLMMPGISGLELLKKVKENRPDTMMIMITGYPSIRTAVEAVKIGAFDYLPKPFTPDDLRSIVSRALTRKRVVEQKVEQSRILEDLPVPQGLHSIPDNSWVKVEDDGSVLVGIHHMLLVTIKKISSIEYPKLNETRYQGEALVRIIESSDRIHKLWTPVTGKIIAINRRIQDDYSKLYQDPYITGWLVQMTPTNLENDLKNLLVT
ncbi:MAG: response regulator [candidate division WOR-3 bacterium]|nr:MAG: response regulator [candidate division WOR-3 bacterium]